MRRAIHEAAGAEPEEPAPAVEPTELGDVPPGAAGRVGCGSARPAPFDDVTPRDEGPNPNVPKVVVAGAVIHGGGVTGRGVSAVTEATMPDGPIAAATGATADRLMTREAPSAGVP